MANTYRSVTTTPGGTLTIDDAETATHIMLEGTAVGFTVAFDDATAFTVDRLYRITNDSTQDVAITNFTGTITETLQPGNVLQATLTDRSAAAGNWNYENHITGTYVGAGQMNTTHDLVQYARLAGRAGGQTIEGGTAASEELTLSSTHHATKGKIALGTSRYDEVNDRLGIGEATPTGHLHLKAGLATAGGAPLKFTDGNVLATAEDGAVEAYKSGLWFTALTPARQSLDGTIFSQTETVTVANTATETTLLGTGRGVKTIPANLFALAGRTLRVTARGYFTCRDNEDLILRVKLTDDTPTTLTVGTATHAMMARARRGWSIQVDITCYNTGATGDFWGQGFANIGSTAAAADVVEMKNENYVELDTSDTIDIDVTADWTNADAGNTITCTNLIVQVLD